VGEALLETDPSRPREPAAFPQKIERRDRAPETLERTLAKPGMRMQDLVVLGDEQHSHIREAGPDDVNGINESHSARTGANPSATA